MAISIRSRDALFGRKLYTFKRSLIYPVIATVIAGFLLFIAIAMAGDGVTEGAWWLRITIFICYPLYIYNQLRSRFIVFDKGFRLVNIFGTQDVLWSDIETFHTTHSAIVSSTTFYRAVIRTRKGKKIVLQNNWNPSDQFYAVISNFITE
jgi:hypothetical protein